MSNDGEGQPLLGRTVVQPTVVSGEIRPGHWQHEATWPILDTWVCFDKGCPWCVMNVCCCATCTVGMIAEVEEIYKFRDSALAFAGASIADSVFFRACGVTTPFTSVCQACYIYQVRREMVQAYGIDESELGTALRAICCGICSIAQMMMELEHQKDGDGTCFSWEPHQYDERGYKNYFGFWKAHRPAAPVAAEMVG
mmetsp:Transcript_27461/g.87030  ORF Transcript_27461/g.87030 Transcript_27461/m.87030 type:complete len:197 (-) Transcript_27461:69-659(-)